MSSISFGINGVKYLGSVTRVLVLSFKGGLWIIN